jgi:hypothetical protein
MSVQRTFRDVAKPKVLTLTATIAGGVLDLQEATHFVFTADAVGGVSSLSGHEYLVDGQPIHVVNGHGSNNLVFTIGAFSHTVPAGYGDIFYYDEGNTSFTRKDNMVAKVLRDDIISNTTAIGTEVTNRGIDTALNYRLDGSRALTGNMDAATNLITQMGNGVAGSDGINKGQLDSAVAVLEASISANATSLAWRKPVTYASKFTSGNIPSNADAVVESNFGAGNNRIFEDDAGPAQVELAEIAVGETALFIKDGLDPKLMIVRDDVGTKRWYDETEADAGKKLEKQVAAGDTMIVAYDLLDDNDVTEGSAIYHIESGTPNVAIKIGDLDWDQATGINISAGYSQGAGGETVITGDSVEAAIQKVDGNVFFETASRIQDVNDKIAQEVIDRDLADVAQAVITTSEIDADILASELAYAATMASTNAGSGASLVAIQDSLLIISATTVEGALAENRTLADTNESDITAIQTDVGTNTSNIGTNVTDIGINATAISDLESDLASTGAGLGASKISVEDLNSDFTATTVEGVLAEIDAKVDNLSLVTHRRGLHEAAATGALTLNLTTDFLDTVAGGGVAQDLSSATFLNCFVIRDGATLVGEVGFTIAGSVLTLTAAGGGELLAGEIVEVRVIEVA